MVFLRRHARRCAAFPAVAKCERGQLTRDNGNARVQRKRRGARGVGGSAGVDAMHRRDQQTRPTRGHARPPPCSALHRRTWCRAARSRAPLPTRRFRSLHEFLRRHLQETFGDNVIRSDRIQGFASDGNHLDIHDPHQRLTGFASITFRRNVNRARDRRCPDQASALLSGTAGEAISVEASSRMVSMNGRSKGLRLAVGHMRP